MDVKAVVLEQLAVDFNTTPQALCGGKNIFTLKKNDPRKRAYENRSAVFQALCINGIVVCSAANSELLEQLRAAYQDCDAAWFLEIETLRELDRMLALFGEQCESYHQYYAPYRQGGVCPPEQNTFWYSDAQLERFRGEDRFCEALAFEPEWPDRLAVTQEKNGETLGMAGASSDSKNLWQIGINVEPKFRQCGIATQLVTLLKNRLLSQGIVPFYGTAASHTASQCVAIASGFVPAWAELYSAPIPKK